VAAESTRISAPPGGRGWRKHRQRDPQQDGKASRLFGSGEECGYRSGGSFIHIRHPEVEGDGRDLETRSHQVQNRPRQANDSGGKVEMDGETVEEREVVPDHRGRRRVEGKVLEPRFRGA
jgi:hypothetical protein